MPKRAYALTWTGPALHDLITITRHIKADKPEAARRFGRHIKEKVSRLAHLPQSGRPVPEFPASGLREVLVGDYRIIYRVVRVVSDKQEVEILTVRHGARPLEGPGSR